MTNELNSLWNRLISWVQDVHGGVVHVHLIDGPRGRGLHANDGFSHEDELVRIPKQCLFNTDTLFPLSRHLRTGLNATQLLSLFLADHIQAQESGDEPLAKSFRAYLDILPWEFPSSPLWWKYRSMTSKEYDQHYQLMPKALQTAVDEVNKRFSRDLPLIQTKKTDLSLYSVLRGWLVVNTRCIYHKTRSPNTDNHLTLCPIIDFINHSTNLPQNPPLNRYNGDMSYLCPEKPQEELTFSYGAHSNAVLLAEYGFVMSNNPFNVLCVDDLMMPLFDDEQHKDLDTSGYWGDWNLLYSVEDHSVIRDHRLNVALARLATSNHQNWLAIVNGLTDQLPHPEQHHALDILNQQLVHFTSFIDMQCNALNDIHSMQAEMITAVWNDYKRIIKMYLEQGQD